MKRSLFIVIVLVFLAACGGTTNIPVTETSTNTKIPKATASDSLILLPSETPIYLSTLTTTLAPEAWKSIPIFPLGVSTRMIDVYRNGITHGRDHSRFSKIGDCQNITPYFLAAFDDPTKYRLGYQYAYLQPTIDHFSGSWSRKSMATHGGFNAATILNPYWTIIQRPSDCEKGESPAACEIRIYNPSFAIISMEENFSGDLAKYDHYLRSLVEYVISQDVVPILATRAELPGASNSINAVIVQVAYDYDIPLWNFGAAAALLPNNGLQKDGFHLTPQTIEGSYYFDDPSRMELGWTLRNLTALQSIDAVYLGVTK
jgi:hypothetical protein